MGETLKRALKWLSDVANPDPTDDLRQICVMYLGHEIGVWIPIPDAEKLLTVGEVKEYVSERLTRETGSRCPSQSAFYRLRKAVVELRDVKRSTVHPSTKWGEVLPRWRGRKCWRAIEESVETSLHPCYREASVGATAYYISKTVPGEPMGCGEVSDLVDRYFQRELKTTDFCDDSLLNDLIAASD